MARTWTTTDAWVFAAIAHDQPPAVHKLTEIIAIADGINHDVLTEDEFTNAVGRLITAGLIDADAQCDRYWPTDAGADLRKRWKHGAFGWITAIPPELNRIAEPQDVAWSLPAGAFQSAVDQYLARAAKWAKRHGRMRHRRMRDLHRHDLHLLMAERETVPHTCHTLRAAAVNRGDSRSAEGVHLQLHLPWSATHCSPELPSWGCPMDA